MGALARAALGGCLLWALGGCAWSPDVPDNGVVPSPCASSTRDCGPAASINWAQLRPAGGDT